MQTTAVGTKRTNVGHARLAGLALALMLLGAVIVGATLSIRPSNGSEVAALPPVRDLTTLALDRDGADVFVSPSRHALDTTGLALDRDGADTFSVPAVSGAADVTMLYLDRDGADIFTTRESAGPDITGLRLDRDGADIP